MLTLEKTPLVSALTMLARIVERRNTIPILSNVLIRTKDGMAHLTATDLDIAITVPLKADGDLDFTVPAHLLLEFAKRAPDGAEIAIKAEGNGARITSGRTRALIPVLPSSDFPEGITRQFTHHFTVPGEPLAAMLRRCLPAFSQEPGRYYLQGAYMHHIEGADVLRCVATDGNRMVRTEIEAPQGCEGMPGIIIPRKACDEIARMAEAVDTVNLSVSDSAIRFETSHGSATSKLIDGTFPDYTRVIPTANPIRCQIKRPAMEAALSRIAIMTDAKSSGAAFAFEQGKLTITRNDGNGNQIADEVAFDGEQDITLGMNIKLLSDSLSAMPGDAIALHMADAGSPVLVTTEGDDMTLAVVMPMRV